MSTIYLRSSRSIRNILSVKVTSYCLIVGFIISPTIAQADDYFFDPALFHGTTFGQNLERFNKQDGQLLLGDQILDVYVNNSLIASQANVVFERIDDKKSMPCLTLEILKKTNIRYDSDEQTTQCILINQLGNGIFWDVDTAQLRLNITAAQKDLYTKPRGYIPTSEWDEGNTALFLRHNTNYSHTKNSSNDYDYLWSNIYSGINFGLWQVRHQGNMRYTTLDTNNRRFQYSSVRTWLQRPISAIESTLIIGETSTDSSLFGGLSFRGAKLGTDQKMWPQSKKGYAPEVRGIATTAARVVIKQNDRTIYETSVPPGEFVINDLYNTPMEGDLNVEVIESNGKISSFTVPYSATPSSVRAGNWDYALSLGEVRQFSDVNNRFIEGTFQYGINNSITANIGARFGHDYQSGLLGGVYASPLGAIALNTVWSHAKMANQTSETGWRMEASYSKSFQATRTNLTLAAYRYSTAGYRDYQDVLGINRQLEKGIYYDSDTLKQRNRLSVTISQPLDDWGSLYMTGSTADYYSDKSRVNQLQLGYNNAYKQFNYNISVARQQILNTSSTSDSSYAYSYHQKTTENLISFSVTMPLDWGSTRSSLSFDASRSKDNKNGNIRLAGAAGSQNDITYSVYAGLEKTKDTDATNTWGASLQKSTSVGSFRGSLSNGKNYHQLNLGASGAFVLHSGGLTTGPYISDTFALVHAPGAKGALIKNGQGAAIDRFGYALMPSLSAYNYNNIVLDTSEMNDDVELIGGGKRIVPYYGSMVKVDFDTHYGHAILINITSPENTISVPMGADVTDEENNSIGMVGQGEQLYVRLNKLSGILNVVWGDNTTQSCQIHYQLSEISDDLMTVLNLPCVQESM